MVKRVNMSEKTDLDLLTLPTYVITMENYVHCVHLVRVDILTRDHAQQSWHNLTQGGIYLL